MGTTIKLPSIYQEMIHLSRYARWIDSVNRRESWEETVDRYIGYMTDVQCKGKIPKDVKDELRESVLHLEVMPSMRCMMTAGKALEIDNVSGYNCAYTSIDDMSSFSEILYILMCGTGCGFSVERQFIASLPAIADKLHASRTVIKVEDSRVGWADAYRELISMLYQGRIPEWDVSEVRPAGMRLKTFGGRASGPEPLVDLFKFTIETFRGSSGRKLNSIECHDLCCKIGEIVVSGGVRRSALLSLSNPSDERMRYAKSGNWAEVTPWRAMANNSVAYTEKPGMDVFMREWIALYESKSGERGIFNREAARAQAAKNGRRDANLVVGSNPCSEILLRSPGLCNLSEVIVRPGDGIRELKRKVELATIMGTMQATLTNFRYLRPIWKKNAEEESLIGVSLTGIMDNELTSGKQGKKELKDLLEALRDHVVKTNKEWSVKLGIAQSAATTCCKPSGTISQLTDTSSGIHPRFARFFIRRVRTDKKDPLSTLMIDSGFPHESDFYKPEHQWVFSFPMRAPKGAIVTSDVGAIEQLEMWNTYQTHWCEHKVSMTVFLREHEWLDAGAWVYRHFDTISGISFLPYSHGYKQAPYEEITEVEYNKMLETMPKSVDWSKMEKYEKEDTTNNSNELVCSAGQCELP